MKKLTNPLNIELERRLRTHYAKAERRQIFAGRDYDEHLVDDFVFQVFNTATWYDLLYKTYYAHLLKFIAKGTYDHERAFKHLYNFANRIAPEYTKEFAPGSKWSDFVSPADRREIAKLLLEKFEALQPTGELDWVLQQPSRD